MVTKCSWSKEERRPSKASAPPGRKKRRLATLYYNHRGLKDTDRKPLGHLYLGVTHTTINSAIQTFTQVKAWTGIMAVVVSSVS